jgi:hypothetical protein
MPAETLKEHSIADSVRPGRANWGFFAVAVILQKLVVIGCVFFGTAPIATGVAALGSAVTAWDAENYLYLAREGYQAGHPTCAFYPLLPYLIGLLSPCLGGNPSVAGLVITNLAGIAGLGLFYQMVWERWGSETARIALAFLLAYPGAMFFSFIYTEPLFLLELMAVWYGIQRGQRRWAALGGFLMPLTRPVGVLIIPILAAWAWQQAGRNRVCSGCGLIKADRFSKAAGWVMVTLCAVSGFLCYLLLMTAWTGDPWEGFRAQRHYPYHPSVANLFNFEKWATAFLKWESFHGSTNSILDRSLFVVFLGSLYGIWRLDRLCFLWSLLAGMIPAFSNCLFSYTRYLLMVFPLFILLGRHFQGTQHRWLRVYYGLLLVTLQAYLIVRYANHQWAG